jgi:hypothetical protein
MKDESSDCPHKGLLRFIEDDDAKGIRRGLMNRVRRILTALVSADSMERLEGPARLAYSPVGR